MTYRIEIDRRGSFPEYRIRNSLREYRADSAADAEYLCWALNHMTEAQHMDALKRETKDAA